MIVEDESKVYLLQCTCAIEPSACFQMSFTNRKLYENATACYMLDDREPNSHNLQGWTLRTQNTTVLDKQLNKHLPINQRFRTVCPKPNLLSRRDNFSGFQIYVLIFVHESCLQKNMEGQTKFKANQTQNHKLAF